MPPEAAGEPLELWRRDEARVGRQGTLTRVWAERGPRPAAPEDRRHARARPFGAARPDRGVGAGLALPQADAAATSLRPEGIGDQASPGARAVVAMDGAGRHQAGGELRVPADVTPPRLPPHAPEPNPVENVRAFLRPDEPSDRVFDTRDAILDACAEARNRLTAQPAQIAAIASRPWARVSQ